MKVIHGDNIELLKQYPDNYFDAIVTDAPYGLGKEPNATELMKDWIEKGYHEVGGSGFMGKQWDAFVPQPLFWKECFRVLKHGGHVLSFFGSRTYDWGVMAMRFAGFEVRDCITWHFGSGFPKSHNISKAIDKMYGAEREVVGEKVRGDVQKAKENGSGYLSDPANRNNEKQFGYGTELITKASTEQAKEWDGYGTALKPASEYICMARKPLEKGLSIAENVLKWGTGAINIDGCRIKVDKDDPNHRHNPSRSNEGENSIFGVGGHNGTLKSEGRFPANLILSHSLECQQVGTKKVKSDAHHTTKYNGNETLYKGGWKDGEDMGNKFADENGEEEIEDWICVDDCPIKILDQQSGVSKSVGGNSGVLSNSVYGKYATEKNNEGTGFGDKGGASRFFKQCNFEENDILFCYLCAKSNNKELWERNYNNVLNVNQILRNTKQTKEHIALKNVTQILKEKADHLVKNVENLCPLCVTNFVQEVVEINNLDSNKEQLNLIRDFTQDYKKCTLLQNLVSYVEIMESIDTTPITQNLLRLFGYALVVIINYINKDTKEKVEQKLESTRFIYQPKASKYERNKGLEGFEEKKSRKWVGGMELTGSGNKRIEIDRNIHPTVKPIKLMQYLVRLVTPPNGIVLDPFCGSGTTGIACKLEGFEFVGLEQDAEYCKIAQVRIDNYVEEKEKSKKSIKPKEDNNFKQPTLF